MPILHVLRAPTLAGRWAQIISHKAYWTTKLTVSWNVLDAVQNARKSSFFPAWEQGLSLPSIARQHTLPHQPGKKRSKFKIQQSTVSTECVIALAKTKNPKSNRFKSGLSVQLPQATEEPPNCIAPRILWVSQPRYLILQMRKQVQREEMTCLG